MERIALADLDRTAQKVLAMLPQKTKGASVIALEGSLGAGKTTFVQALGRVLGVESIMRSPTYVLMKKYDISCRNFTTLIHIDAYRLNNPEEFKTLKPEAFLKESQNLVCIEWPERVAGEIPKPDITLHFSSDGASEEERYIEIA